jgi:class 3 adenylate cyclase
MNAHARTTLKDDATADDNASVHFLTLDEAWGIFDRAAWRYLGMTGKAFIAAWDAASFDDDPDRPALIRVSPLRPVGR